MSRSLKLLLILTVVAVSLRYWIAASIHHPDDPFTVVALCKSGDIEYYPMIAALARGELGESLVYEELGKGITSFPIASVALHAASVAVFGKAGLVVVDVLVYLAFYGVLLLFLKAVRIDSPWRECIALFTLCGGAELLFLATHNRLPAVWQFLVAWDCTFWVWGERVPRPFVSEIPFLLALTVLLWAMRSRGQLCSLRNWSLFGVVLAALLQGDLHGTIILCLIGALVAMYALWRARGRVLPALACAAGVFIAGSGIFLWQRLGEHSDVVARFGVFPAGRLDPRFLEVYPLRRLVLVVGLLAAAAAGVCCFGARVERPFKLRVLAFFFLACVLACFALPISVLVLGKGVQIYHFTERFMHLRTYVALVAGVWLLQALTVPLGGAVTRIASHPRSRLIAVCLAVAWAGAWMALGIFRPAAPVDRWVNGPFFQAVQRDENLHMRAATFGHWAQLPNYRRDFAALATELEKPRYESARVIGTLDMQVFSWWTTFHPGGCSFLPESFLTTASDSAIESRLATFCKLLGLDSATFRGLLTRRYVSVFWLGCDKYQASKAFCYAPLDDYTKEARAHLLETSIYSNWNIAVPVSELRRLVSAYEQALPENVMPRLDLIVLIRNLEDFTPPTAQFELCYENPTFRVWERRQPQAVDQNPGGK